MGWWSQIIAVLWCGWFTSGKWGCAADSYLISFLTKQDCQKHARHQHTTVTYSCTAITALALADFSSTWWFKCGGKIVELGTMFSKGWIFYTFVFVCLTSSTLQHHVVYTETQVGAVYFYVCVWNEPHFGLLVCKYIHNAVRILFQHQNVFRAQFNVQIIYRPCAVLYQIMSLEKHKYQPRRELTSQSITGCPPFRFGK